MQQQTGQGNHFSLPCDGGIWQISHPFKVTSSGGLDPPHFTSKVTSSGVWVGSSKFHIQTKPHQLGVGILHISSPVKITLSPGLGSSIFHIQTKSHQWEGWDPPHSISSQSHIIWERGVGWWHPPHFTSSQSHHGGGWVVSSTFHIIKVTSSGGILHISPTKLNAPQQ